MEATAQETITPEAALSILQDQLQKLLVTIKGQTGIPGISLGLNIGPQKITANVGTISIDSDIPMTENTHFQLGCLTKLLTSMVAAELITAGKLDPDDPIEKYLYELRNTERGRNIEIWHLLSHTSGYPGLNINDPGTAYYYTWPKLIEYLKVAPPFFISGTVFSYEHSEYVILGEIIKRITGKSVLELFTEIIFEPLHIKVGSIKKDQRGKYIYAIDHVFNPETMEYTKLAPVPFGDFWHASLSHLTMSLKDILRISAIICGIEKDATCLSESALNFVKKQVVKVPYAYGSSRHENIPLAFGVGSAFYRGWIYGKNGSARGQTCGLRFDPNNKISFVVGINAWLPYIRDTIINNIFGVLRRKAIPEVSAEPFETSLEDLAGTYIGVQGYEIVVTCEGDQIACLVNHRNSTVLKVLMKKDEKGILHTISDTQHFSLGFFIEPDSGYKGLMLGMLAFRKQ
jgi:CubicO group peptidase (beta-lactamase class C family)